MAGDPDVTFFRPDRDLAVGDPRGEELGGGARAEDVELPVPERDLDRDLLKPERAGLEGDQALPGVARRPLPQRLADGLEEGARAGWVLPEPAVLIING